jgi:V/A-type H+-transporting ATPase subunit K
VYKYKKGRQIVNDARKNLKLRITQSLIIVFSVMVIVFTGFCSKAFSQTASNAANVNVKDQDKDLQMKRVEEMKFALLAAAVAFGLGALGAGIAIAHVGAAAMGAIAEKPQVAGQALIFIALGEGIVIFGFITAIMIMGKV